MIVCTVYDAIVCDSQCGYKNSHYDETGASIWIEVKTVIPVTGSLHHTVN